MPDTNVAVMPAIKKPAKNALKKKTNKSLFRRINAWLHLWLGLTSGIIVFIVSITGCIYAFEKEIRNVTQPYQFVAPQDKAYMSPSTLKAIAEKHQFGVKAGKPGSLIQSVQYPGRGKAAIATYRDKKTGFMMIYMNPYSGEVLKVKALEKDFFRMVLMGHFNLWLPRDVGQPIVSCAILIFVVLLITGLIMWWPKNLKKANLDKSFKVKWTASFKRVNHDLHNVLGFYVVIGAMIVAITGLSFGFKWLPKSIYWVASGGKKMPDKKGKFTSDTTTLFKSIAAVKIASPADTVWSRLYTEYKGQGSLQIQFPATPADAITTSYNSKEGTLYKSLTRYFDQYTLKEIKGNTIFNKPYEDGTIADKLIRMNYDIHVGAIGGIAGKALAFLISFICASLPVTGCIIWWGKRKKKPATKKLQTKRVVDKTFITVQ